MRALADSATPKELKKIELPQNWRKKNDGEVDMVNEWYELTFLLPGSDTVLFYRNNEWFQVADFFTIIISLSSAALDLKLKALLIGHL
jgi:hypothetical protein